MRTKLMMMLAMVLMVCVGANGAAIQIDCSTGYTADGGTGEYSGTNAPAQQVDSAVVGSTWNAVSTSGSDEKTAFTPVDDSGVTMTGVTVKGYKNANSRQTGDTSGFWASALAGDVWLSGGTIGMYVTGLAAGDYDVYVLSTAVNERGNYHNAFVAVTASASTPDYTTLTPELVGKPNQASAWTEGKNYSKQTVTVSDTSDYLHIFTRRANSDGSDNGGNEGSIAGVQIVPEPATMAVLGLGGLGVLLRRKRR